MTLTWGGLWSLPAGGVEEDESLENAVIREFKEESNLDVTVNNQVYILERNGWGVIVFEVDTITQNYDLKSNDSDIDDLKYFEFDNLPEEIVLEGYLCILRYLTIKNKITEHFSKIIDKVFTSIFYSYLYSNFSKFNFNEDHQLFKYIILSTPNRKFKSIVPFLLSNSDKKNRYQFLIPELCFAIWTLLDDCYDEKMTRYGIDTAIAKFGKKKAMISLYQAIQILRELLNDKVNKGGIEKIADSLSKSAHILNSRNEHDYLISIDEHIKQSAERTEFLRSSWAISMLETNTDETISSLLFQIQKMSSEIGQLINDYFDITRGNLEDYDNKTASAHWIFLKRELLEKEEIALLNSLWYDNQNRKNEYKKLIYTHQIKEKLHYEIRNKLLDMNNYINNSNLSNDHKNVLLAWHQLSYQEFFPEIEDDNIIVTFLNTIDNIFYKI